MPARVVVPQAIAGFNHGATADDAMPLDLEAKFIRAASRSLGAELAADTDLLEALACQACEAFDDIEQNAARARLVLKDTLGPLLEERSLGDDAQQILFDAFLHAAGVEPVLEADNTQRSSSDDRRVALPTVLQLPAHGPPALRKAKVARQTLEDADVKPHAHTENIGSQSIDATSEVCEARYRRRGEVQREEAAEYLRLRAEMVHEQREEVAAREVELANFRRWPTKSIASASDQDAQGTSLPTRGPAPQDSDSSSDSEEDDETIRDREATKRRLREMGEVATFFGESDSVRWRRLQQCELQGDQDELATGSTNVMQILDRQQNRARDAAGVHTGADVVDADDAELDTKATIEAAGEDSNSEDEGPFVPGTDVGEQDPEAVEAQHRLDDAIISVTSWLRSTLRAWEKSLTERAAAQEKLQNFKVEKAQYRQSKQYLKPLRRSLRDSEIAPDIVFNLAAVSDHCEKRQYKLAEEAYMRLAIGNSAWPMGVTMVTFHDRASRHLIGEGAHAHVLDDETTRRYVQMVKRLLTFAQRYWPIDRTVAE